MVEFTKYMHIERLNSQEVEGILDGKCYIFPKIDGTNASVWYDEDTGLQAGSRNRVLSIENDNAGFCSFVYENIDLIRFYLNEDNRHLIFYGEWLVPHSLKTYRKDAWRRFYVFDILDTRTGLMLPYEDARGFCEDFKLDYIPPLVLITNPTEEDLYLALLKCGQFLIEDGQGQGEGITIKNYDFVNKYGRQVWAKIITNEFKEKHHKEMGAPEVNGTMFIEQMIIDKFMTEEFVKKEQAKIILNHNNEYVRNETSSDIGGWDNRWVPELLGRTWYEFIREEMTTILKDFRNPKINFRLLNTLCIKKVKEVIGL
jgi:hypothetical protein